MLGAGEERALGVAGGRRRAAEQVVLDVEERLLAVTGGTRLGARIIRGLLATLDPRCGGPAEPGIERTLPECVPLGSGVRVRLGRELAGAPIGGRLGGALLHVRERTTLPRLAAPERFLRECREKAAVLVVGSTAAAAVQEPGRERVVRRVAELAGYCLRARSLRSRFRYSSCTRRCSFTSLRMCRSRSSSGESGELGLDGGDNAGVEIPYGIRDTPSFANNARALIERVADGAGQCREAIVHLCELLGIGLQCGCAFGVDLADTLLLDTLVV